MRSGPLFHRIRRASDPGGAMETEEAGSVASDDHPSSLVEVSMGNRHQQGRDERDERDDSGSANRSPSQRSEGN